MDYHKEQRKRTGKLHDRDSFRARGRRSQSRREYEVRSKIILMNAALALVIIMIVLICKIVSLNKNGSAPVKDTNEKVAEQDVDKSGDNGKSKDEKAKATAVPAQAASTSGQAKWLRKDLDPDKPMIALTFDDGPYTPVTKKILNVLKKYDSKATFFVVGNRVARYSDVVKRAYDEGNEIASHTFDHSDLSKMNKKQIKAEMKKTNKAVSDVIGCNVSLIRPPYGNINDLMRSTIKIPMIYWSLDTDDWLYRDSKKVLKECKCAQDGEIILMHDLYPTTAAAVKKLVPRLVKQGYQLVTVDELLYYKGIDATAGKVYASGK